MSITIRELHEHHVQQALESRKSRKTSHEGWTLHLFHEDAAELLDPLIPQKSKVPSEPVMDFEDIVSGLEAKISRLEHQLESAQETLSDMRFSSARVSEKLHDALNQLSIKEEQVDELYDRLTRSECPRYQMYRDLAIGGLAGLAIYVLVHAIRFFIR